MATSRFTAMAAAAGLLVVLLGIVPTSQSRLPSSANSTAAANATDAVITTGSELLPLAVLLLAVGAILSGTGVLGRFR
jgi:hypothetical protein